ncbi:3-hydroxybutyrate dehydrogenase [Salinimonas iocasae]|uniref:3-hydroxybutyrate dehydrogenase n=2 Tax=Salinimonas iocasae TaxID=2572577 RepID=A0A5B7YF27_9ALTE|nr:3-hydroxybutyrate dehydrogenase [Salinimonas iocasae]QCZ93970.1 3-hydroxybutyrate dehydrogenase [Salinimonas iocasae]
MMSHTIFITGGASGIGFGIAENLAKDGHHVVLADINEQAATDAAKRLTDQHLKASAIAVDVTDAEAVAALPRNLGNLNIDILINNAGIQHVSRLEEFPAQKWQQLIDIMLVAPALLTQAFLPGMRERNFGRIINVGSIHSLVASPYKSAYVSAKHGLLGFAKTLALEVAEANITVNTLCPAYVKTPLVEKQIADQAKENGISEDEVVNEIMLKPMPKKAFITIEELAGTARFLISDAARNITAQTMVLDGGWTAR